MLGSGTMYKLYTTIDYMYRRDSLASGLSGHLWELLMPQSKAGVPNGALDE